MVSKETKDDDDDTVDIVSLWFLAMINDCVHVSRFLVVRGCMNAYEVGQSNGRRVIGSYAADVIQFIIWRKKRGNISAGDNVGCALWLTAKEYAKVVKIFQLLTHYNSYLRKFLCLMKYKTSLH